MNVATSASSVPDGSLKAHSDGTIPTSRQRTGVRHAICNSRPYLGIAYCTFSRAETENCAGQLRMILPIEALHRRRVSSFKL
jgi:hypothetical protein